MSVMENPALVEDADDQDDERPRRQFTKELWFLLVVALGLAVFMKTFLVQAFFIPSGSMEKTLHGCPGCTGDRVLVNKVVYDFRDIHRGEIVVFNGKGTSFNSETVVPQPRNLAEKVMREAKELIGFGGPGEKDFIKRVIGVPGDVVACCDPEGRVTVNGEPLNEDAYVYLSAWVDEPADKQYLSAWKDDEDKQQAEFTPTTVPEGHLFVMGDHRDGSSDSRYNGTIPVESVVGRAFAVFYPYDRRKVLRVPGTFDGAAAQPVPQAGAAGAEAAPAVLGFAAAVPITVLRRRLRRTTD